MFPTSFPRFSFRKEPTWALKVGAVFFPLITLLFFWAAWHTATRPPDETPEEIQYRIRQEANEELAKRGFPGFPMGEPPTPGEPEPLEWMQVMAFAFTGLACVFTVCFPLASELRSRLRSN